MLCLLSEMSWTNVFSCRARLLQRWAVSTVTETFVPRVQSERYPSLWLGQLSWGWWRWEWGRAPKREGAAHALRPEEGSQVYPRAWAERGCHGIERMCSITPFGLMTISHCLITRRGRASPLTFSILQIDHRVCLLHIQALLILVFTFIFRLLIWQIL